ncbi:hypothetical protein BS78_05G194000 [Paspalum vaginatum]|nr:hypothetical protein BS78_05G194000 [Paspalum vaginatum]KAJ1276176.1 hypothetical protein BS78_05G194000 [Paspalum vaginatum]
MNLIVLLILHLMPTVAAQPWQICGTGNYTANSTYQLNLDGVSGSGILTEGSDASDLFAKGAFGRAPDIVYAVALCRGDVNTSSCSTCLDAAVKGARQLCPMRKDAAIFYDQCLLRFSDTDILNMDSASRVNSSAVVDGALVLMNMSSEPMVPGWGTNSEAATNFTQSLKTMLTAKLVEQVLSAGQFSRPKFYATIRMDMDGASMSTAVRRLYGLAQCAPDLIEDICYECLTNLSNRAVVSIAGRQGGRVLGLRCNLRYDTSKFFDGKPTWSSGSSNDVVPSPAPQPNSLPPPLLNQKKLKGKVLVIALVVPLLVLFIFVFIAFRLRRYLKGKNTLEEEALIWGQEGRSSEFTIYDFSQVLEATNNFSEENKLGQGGFGPVYKGAFPNGVEIAVTRLASHSGQGLTEFKNEIQLIAKLQHTDPVRLLGCCYQGQEKLLVYEYLPNKSLDFFIFDETRRALVDWNKRLRIIDGTAQGLLYLHKHSRLRVIHRDLKAGNILLDHEMNPKISDFGLAKIFSTNDTEGNTRRIVGTYGYMAPEYASEGLFSIKSDVYSFGVLVLEIVSGKRTSSFHRYGEFINLLGHAWQMWKDETWHQLVDSSLLGNESYTPEMMRCINIALLCVQENATDRPPCQRLLRC